MAEFRVILVDPLYEGNVGHAARSMLNFGIDDLAIVKGCSIGKEGQDRAVHAQVVLENARRTETLAEAGKGCDLLVGFTARMTGRERRFRRNPVDLRDWAPQAAAAPGRIGLVFGREDRGLTNEETEHCDVLVAIPTDDRYRSMNLAHAITVACWSVYAEGLTGRVKEYTPADPDLVERIHDAVEEVMEVSGYAQHKRATTRTMFRRLLGRAAPTQSEAVHLMGLFKKTLWKMGRARPRPEAELPLDARDDPVRVDDPGLLDALDPARQGSTTGSDATEGEKKGSGATGEPRRD